MGFGKGENKPLRGISGDCPGNAGASPRIGGGRARLGAASVTGFASVVDESGVGVFPKVLEERRSRRCILESFFFSDDNFEALLGAGDGDLSRFIGLLEGDISRLSSPFVAEK